jgi:hypothetical protein
MCLIYQRYYDFAVGVCLEVVWLLQLFPQDSVVVDLAVDGEGDCLVIVDDGLGAGVCSRELLFEHVGCESMFAYLYRRCSDAHERGLYHISRDSEGLGGLAILTCVVGHHVATFSLESVYHTTNSDSNGTHSNLVLDAGSYSLSVRKSPHYHRVQPTPCPASAPAA